MKLNKFLFPALGALCAIVAFFALRHLYEKNLKTYEIRIQAVVPRQDQTEPYFFRGFEPETIERMVADLNVMYYHARIRFVFDAKTDLDTLTDALLHADIPASGMSLADSNLMTVKAQRNYAGMHANKLVIFFRNGVNDQSDYSGSVHPYVRISRGYHPKELAHLIGHYFNLHHTYREEPADLKEALELIRDALEQGIPVKKAGQYLFDGDGLSDTPNDPGERLMCATNNRGLACINKTDCGFCLSGGCFYCRKCSNHEKVELKLNFRDTTDPNGKVEELIFDFRPDRQNVMGQYLECNEVHTLHFSEQQIAAMRSSFRRGNRQTLVR